MTLGAILLLLGAGALAGLLGGLFGIGGGVVVVPALYAVLTAMDVPEDSRIKLAIGTSLATIVITSARSLRAHLRTGRVDTDLLRRWAPFIAGGAVAGAALARVAPPDGLTLFLAFGLLMIGVQRLFAGKGARAGGTLPGAILQRVLAMATGTASSLMGIGGGVFGVLLLTWFGRPVHVAVATAAGFGLAIAVPGTLGFVVLGQGADAPPFTLGYVYGPGMVLVAGVSALTAPLGARAAHALPAPVLTRGFALYLLATGVLLTREALG